MFASLKLRGQILLGYLVPMALLVIVAFFVYNSVQDVDEKSAAVSHINTVIFEIKDLQNADNTLQRTARGYLLQKEETSANAYSEGKAAVQEHLAKLKALVKDDAAQQTLEKIGDTTNKIEQLNDHLIKLVDEGKPEEAVTIWKQGEGKRAAQEMNELVNEFEKRELELRETQSKEEEAALGWLLRVVIFGALVATTLAVITALWIAAMIGNRLKEAVGNIAGASNEISTTLEQHERTAAQQSASVNETTTTMEELDRSSRQSATQADSATEKAQQVLKLADEGSTQIVQAQTATRNLQERVSGIAEQILKLSEQTSQIQGITALVSDLANQTNLLALNAAVEAARAGEHGKGFAVVATEIRKLADESKKSANRINTLVGDIQRATNSTVMVTEEGTKRVEEVTRIAQQNADVLKRIASSADGASQSVQQISLNVSQQAAAIRQVVDAMGALNAGAKETASGLRQTKEGVQNINSAAQRLNAMV